MMKTKSGFTLAEVLTTLMVIGVVAAMTIPTLMNSTGEQQARVACKKAASILSQGVQLLIAKEEECPNIKDNASLAACMSQVISGTVSDNKIMAPDGMVYYFFVPDGTVKDGSGDDAKTTTKTLEVVCGQRAGAPNGGSNCGVLIDTNGLSKGVKDEDEIKKPDGTGDIFGSADGFKDSIENGSDRVAFMLYSTGVTPVAIKGGNNNAWKYMNGSVASKDDFEVKYCCTKDEVKDRGDAENATCDTDRYDSYPICDSVVTVKKNADCPTDYEELAVPEGKRVIRQNECF